MSTILVDSPEKVAAWSKAVREIGVPVLMLAVMSFAMYQGATWIGNYVLIPTMEDNKKLVSEQVQSNQALLNSLNAITKNIQHQTDLNAENSKALTSMANDIKAIKDASEKTADEIPRFTGAAKENTQLLLDQKILMGETLKAIKGGS